MESSQPSGGERVARAAFVIAVLALGLAAYAVATRPDAATGARGCECPAPPVAPAATAVAPPPPASAALPPVSPPPGTGDAGAAGQWQPPPAGTPRIYGADLQALLAPHGQRFYACAKEADDPGAMGDGVYVRVALMRRGGKPALRASPTERTPDRGVVRCVQRVLETVATRLPDRVGDVEIRVEPR